ncbi:WD40-repeat-containing domain protein [Obelidium mucronatum]|nr:WD40-repeat-containing domain protein [Obelidium mucronatum]
MTHSLYSLSAQLEGHSQDVKALAADAHAQAAAEQTLFSASRDGRVLRWTRGAAAPGFQLRNAAATHAHFANSLAVLAPTPAHPAGLVASGSQDKSVAVADPRADADAEPLFVLLGHEDNVSALAVDGATGGIISGSWDKTAKLWVNWECVLTLKGHEQAVWAVMSAGDYGILTGALTVCVRENRIRLGTDCLSQSASADKTIKLWKDGNTIRVWAYSGECLAELSAHTSFVYGLTILPGGGFASCGEDRTVRIWKADGLSYKCVQTIQHPMYKLCERAATLEQVKAFDDAVAKHQIPSNQVGDVDKTKLPGIEALANPGRPDQVIMIRSGDLVEAHQFTDGQWVKIGEVVDAVGGGRKQMYGGREYDFVFDIDIGAGQNLKLPYNNSENPYMAAQRFIDTHELNQDFLDQIGNFIIQNAKPTTIGQELNSNFVDPFTGAGRYVPGSAASVSSAAVTAPVENLFPGVYSTFAAINCKGVKTKITQLNGDSSKVEGRVLTADDLSTLSSLLDLIEAGKDKVASSLNQRYWDVVSKIAYEWPESVRFPGIDIIRVSVLYSSAPLSMGGADLLPKLLNSAGLTNSFAEVGSETNKMLAMRAIANFVGTKEGIEYMYKNRQTIVDVLGYKWSLSSNANLRLAVAAVFLNLTIVLKERKDDSFSFDLLTHLLQFLAAESDVENEYRILIALGTLLKDNNVAQEAAGFMDIKAVLKGSKNKSVEKIVKAHRAVLKK